LSLKAFIPEEGDVRTIEIVEAVTAYTLIDVFPDALPRDAEKRTDKPVFCCRRGFAEIGA